MPLKNKAQMHLSRDCPFSKKTNLHLELPGFGGRTSPHDILGKEKAHKHKQNFLVTAQAGGGGSPDRGGGSLIQWCTQLWLLFKECRTMPWDGVTRAAVE